MRQAIQRILASTLDVLAPKHCLLCRRFAYRDGDPWLCNLCIAQLPLLQEPLECRPNIFALGYLQAGWQELMHHYKFQGRRELLPIYVRLCSEHATAALLADADYYLPVPMTAKRLRQRGFDQTLLLAKALARKNNKRLLSDLIFKTQQTDTQTNLGRDARRANLKGCFAIDIKRLKSLPADARLLLVDDVTTTGATLEHCMEILLIHAPLLRIKAFALAYTPPKKPFIAAPPAVASCRPGCAKS